MRRSGTTATILAITATALALQPTAASAQTKTGTAIAQFTGIEPGARHAAMGNAGVALNQGIQSIYYNPASLGALDSPAFQFTHSAWFADINFDYVAASIPTRWGTAFTSLTVLDSGDIDVRTVAQPLGTGERYSVVDFALGLGFGRQITQQFAAGGRLSFVNERIWNSSSSLVTFDIGTIYEMPIRGISIGSSLSNLGTDSSFSGRDLTIQFDPDPDVHGNNSSLPADQFAGEFPVPILFRIGVSFERRLAEESELTLLLDAFHPSDNTESISTGAEWSWKETLSLRGGYQNLFQQDSELGLTLGAGIQKTIGERRFQFDYAWATHERLNETHRSTFVLEF